MCSFGIERALKPPFMRRSRLERIAIQIAVSRFLFPQNASSPSRDQFIEFFLDTEENSAGMTERCRPHGLGHRPTFTSKFLENDPVAGFEPRTQPLELADRIDLHLGEGEARAVSTPS